MFNNQSKVNNATNHIQSTVPSIVVSSQSSHDLSDSNNLHSNELPSNTELTKQSLTKQSDEVYRFKFVYDIENISDWVELQNRLQSVRLLEQYKPSLFTTDKVEGYVDFLGNGDKFVLLLSQNKINAVNLGPYYRISLDD